MPTRLDNRMKTVVALATVALSLGVAGTASAQPNTGQTPAKKGCSIQFQGPGAGQSLVYPDGYKFVVNATDGKTHTYTCNDGTWTDTVSLTASGTSLFSRNLSILSTSRTLQAVQFSR